MVTMTRSKLKSRLQHDLSHLQPLNNIPPTHQPPTLNGCRDIAPDKILKVKVTTVRSKVKSRSHSEIAHLQLPTNVPTKY